MFYLLWPAMIHSLAQYPAAGNQQLKGVHMNCICDAILGTYLYLQCIARTDCFVEVPLKKRQL